MASSKVQVVPLPITPLVAGVQSKSNNYGVEATFLLGSLKLAISWGWGGYTTADARSGVRRWVEMQTFGTGLELLALKRLRWRRQRFRSYLWSTTQTVLAVAASEQLIT